jgi:putative endonuclease
VRAEVGGWTYMLASGRNGTLYTGSTTELIARVRQHREGVEPSFTRKYGVTRLVWFEAHESVAAAFKREHQIKRWLRKWKIALIEKANPQWRDLYADITSNLPRVTFLRTLPGRGPGLEPGRDPGSRG